MSLQTLIARKLECRENPIGFNIVFFFVQIHSYTKRLVTINAKKNYDINNKNPLSDSKLKISIFIFFSTRTTFRYFIACHGIFRNLLVNCCTV